LPDPKTSKYGWPHVDWDLHCYPQHFHWGVSGEGEGVRCDWSGGVYACFQYLYTSWWGAGSVGDDEEENVAEALRLGCVGSVDGGPGHTVIKCD